MEQVNNIKCCRTLNEPITDVVSPRYVERTPS